MKRYLAPVFLTLVASFLLPAASSASAELDERVWEAGEVMKEFMSIPEHRIPPNLLKNAKAIGIFPNMAKAGFIVAGQFGRGLVIHRDEATGEWSAPAFFRISGGSVGFQIGGQATDVILVITNERGVRGVLQNKFTLGADASVAAGPVGRDADARTDWHLKANVLSYSRSKGLFAGVSLDGVVINQDRGANAEYYGEEISAQEILIDRKVTPTAKAQDLIGTIESYS